MSQRRVHITGARGRWLAQVEGRWLAVLHSSWRDGPTAYFDPMHGVKPDWKRYQEFVEALNNEELVVIQRDKSAQDFTRDGYVGVFKFTDLEIGDDLSIRLNLVSRYADPK